MTGTGRTDGPFLEDTESSEMLKHTRDKVYSFQSEEHLKNTRAKHRQLEKNKTGKLHRYSAPETGSRLLWSELLLI